jgi:branched-chain amino acid transport system permease protein
MMVMQLLATGTAMGFIYCLVAIEYSLIWNSCQLLNFAHTQIIMLGAFLFGGTFVLGLGMSYAIGAVATLLVMAVISVILAVIVFIPLKDMPRLYAIIATLMVGIIITESCNFIWGYFPLSLTGYLSGIVRIGGVVLARVYVSIMIVAVIVIVTLTGFMKLTKVGKAMRCVAENKSMSAMVGINVSANMIVTIMISCLICAIVGILTVPLFSISTVMSTTIATKGFIAAVFGGFGSIPGAIVGGILLGIIENLATVFVDSVYKDVVSFFVLIIVILIKPSGICGASKASLRGRASVFNRRERMDR